ncbi:MAG: hypothetical protein ACQEQZ_00685 [Pseudomonadota bacterium]
MRLDGLGVQPFERYPGQPADKSRQQDNAKTEAPENGRRNEVIPAADSSRQRAQRWQQLNTFYDEPPQSSRRALEAYQGVQLNDRREQVESMFSVDLYA